MLLAEVAAVSRSVAASAARSRKTELIADALRRAPADEVPIVVSFLTGELRQRRTGVGWAALRESPMAASAATLTVTEVDARFAQIAQLSGAGSTAARRRLLGELLALATTAEQQFVFGLISGELRQGALEGVMLDAVARAAGVPGIDVRRAVMLCGDLSGVAGAVLRDGAGGLAAFRIEVGRPLLPMLAQTATSVDDAMGRIGDAAVDWKLDGVRVQVHRDCDEVSVFTRTLDDITARVPEVVELARALPADTVVLDAEAIALRPDGRPRPFQQTGSRMASRTSVDELRVALPLTTYVFDVLHLDGTDLIGFPAGERYSLADAALPAAARVPRLLTGSSGEAQSFFDDALARGHEGVVVKSLEATYDAGRRGAGWLKVKPVRTLDLVVLAAEWGHGRRRGWLSNLHLGARDPDTGTFVMLGKTFKGMTDEMLRWQTGELLARATSPTDGWVVQVRPELVVETAFDGVQTSPRYPAGIALRFARIVRYRSDKPAAEADTVASVREWYVP